MFKVEIETDSAAFEAPISEISRILREIAKRVEAGDFPPFSVRDHNGNTVAQVLEI